MDKVKLKAIIDAIFDVAERMLAGRPVIGVVVGMLHALLTTDAALAAILVLLGQRGLL